MTTIDTALTRLLEIDVPIVQAPIGPCAGPELAAAVSEAGGLGMLALTWQAPQDVAGVIGETRARTGRPFGVNLILEWDQRARLDACLEAGARIVSFFWGDPGPYVEAVHDAGGLVAHTVATAEEARRVADQGVDVVVAQGVEAGGHVWGELATMPLIPAVVDAVDPVPVVAAGGIADGRGLAAALVLGAAGAWMGTRFLASVEARAHPDYKRAVVEGRAEDAVLTTVFALEWPGAKHRVLRTDTLHSGEQRSAALPTHDMTGDVGSMAMYAGQSVGSIDEILPAAEIVRRTADEAAAALGRVTPRG